MKPEGSLPHSQVRVTCPYPQPAHSNPYRHNPLPGDPSWYYPPIYAWFSPEVSFPQASPPKPCTHLSPPPYAPHALPISFVSILPPAPYLVRSTDHSAPHYVVFSHSPVTSSLLGPNILLTHPQPTFLPHWQRPSFTPMLYAPPSLTFKFIHGVHNVFMFCVWTLKTKATFLYITLNDWFPL